MEIIRKAYNIMAYASYNLTRFQPDFMGIILQA